MKKRHRRAFTQEFKAETVKLIRKSGRTIASVSQELGLTATSVGRWLKEADASGAGRTLTTGEQGELLHLRKENRELRMEREILRKATAFFAKESR